MDSKSHHTCVRCVMDTTDRTLVFDENGVCPRCNEYEQ